jgi:hypothetical protein
MSKKDILKAIRCQCSTCFGETQPVKFPISNPQDVKECTSPNCYLYPYRLGKDPNVSHKRSENAKKRGFGKKEIKK